MQDLRKLWYPKVPFVFQVDLAISSLNNNPDVGVGWINQGSVNWYDVNMHLILE